MKLEEIFAEWKQDAAIDRTELGQASLDIPYLHHKYYKILVEERCRQKVHEDDYNKLYKVKYEYLMGLLDLNEIKRRGWEPQPLKILKQDMHVYINADEDLSIISNKINIQKEKVELLESIIRVVMNRGYNIRGAIDWEKFKAGA